MPTNTEGERSELREGVRQKVILTSVWEEISSSNAQHIQTLGIEGIQF
jgi:hypothetical protein